MAALSGRFVHREHTAEPGIAYVPDPHAEHCPVPSTRLKPAWHPYAQLLLLVPGPDHVPLPVRLVHCLHAVAPVSAEYVPAEQLRQTGEPRRWKVPAVQLAHAVDPLPDDDPGGHGTHSPPIL